MRRERRLGIAAAVLTIGLLGALGLSAYQAYKNTENARRVEQRIRGMLERAKDRLAKTDDDRRNAIALRGLARAIRLDPNSAEAVKLTEQLLLGKNWCPPLSQTLRHPQPLMCAAFTPDNRQIVAVAQDGNLVRWNAQDFTQLSSIALVPTSLRGERALSSAAFSSDGKRILVGLNPSGKENARVWGWSDQDGEYRQGTMVSVELKMRFVPSRGLGTAIRFSFFRPDSINRLVASFDWRAAFTKRGRKFRIQPPGISARMDVFSPSHGPVPPFNFLTRLR